MIGMLTAAASRWTLCLAARCVGVWNNESEDEGRFDPLMKPRVIEEGLLIPREVVERALPGSKEVEIFEEPGRLLIAPADGAGRDQGPDGGEEDPILNLGRNPVRTGTRDGSANHDRYLYGA